MSATFEQVGDATSNPGAREEPRGTVAAALCHAALIAFVTALVVAAWDFVSALGGDVTGSRSHLALSASSLLVTVFVPGAVLLCAWWFAVWRVATRGGSPIPGWRKWLASSLAGLPLLAFVWWVPWSWVDENLPALSPKKKWLVVAVYAAMLLAVVVFSRIAWWGYEQYRKEPRRLPLAHWPLCAVVLALAAACYWADRSVLVDLYEDFHYGLSGAFVLGIAACVGAGYTALLRLRPRALDRLITPDRFLLLGWAALLVACVLVQLIPSSAARASDALVLSKLRLALLHHSDFDGDGHSTFFGGLDCAAFDPFQGPAQVDLPGNGRDEDCTGSDATWPRPNPPRHYAIPAVRGYNLVVITVDALRADHTHFLGYKRKTTPNLDKLAQQGLVFTRAYSQGTKTFESLPSLFTGLYLSNVPRDYHHKKVKGRKSHVYRMTGEAPTFTQLIDAQGYLTRGILPIDWIWLLGIDRGFDKAMISNRDPDTIKRAKKFLSDASQPFFLYMHLFGPHAPYKKQSDHDFGNKDVDRYDGEIANIDESIGGIVEELERAGAAQRTIIVVTADHGEEFREHGGQFHGGKLYEELLHVPLIIMVPGVEPGRVDEVVELVDVAPTLCEALALQPRCDEYDGQSLWATRAGLRDNSPGLRGAYAEAMMRDGMLFRRTLLSQGFRLTFNLDQETLELFDTKRDPREAHNLALEQPDRVRQMRDEMALRPYWHLAKPFEALRSSDSTELAKALPRLRSEPLLRLAVEAIGEHPSSESRAALELLWTRPGLGPSVRPKLEEALLKIAR